MGDVIKFLSLPAAWLRCALLLLACVVAAAGQQYEQSNYAALRWRLVGPHRAGRVTAVAGIPDRPAVYYMATPGGGVWKTTDGGVVWEPVFDAARVSSVGALALAPSNPEIVYVGTGEETEGDGVYKSTDGGATWTQVGLRETRYITSIIVDPHDSNVVLVGSFGDPVSGNARGIYRTTDGGKTWRQVLSTGDRAGIADMCAAPGDPRTVYAAAYAGRSGNPNDKRPPAESNIYKSTDGGETWRQLSGRGLPENSRGRIGVAAAPKEGRVYAVMNQGFFRSDDGGESWARATTDARVVGSWFFGRTFADPRDPDTVYVMQTSTYRSTDGGKTFEAWKGTPSGEDDHVLWIDPSDTRRMLMGTDQGATVTLDGGRTWSLWYNQPTGQLYHVITDEQFPYYAYAAQQDSGSVAVPNRGDYGRITYRDWFSTGAFESGYIAPDPRDPNLIYSVGWYGTVIRLDRRTGQLTTLFVPSPKQRYTWETPLVFSPVDHRTLYVGMQSLIASDDGAKTWRELSPDLTVKTATPQPSATPKPASTPARVGHTESEESERDGLGEWEESQGSGPPTGVILAIAPSPVRAGQVWVGTSTGLLQLTRDEGKTWREVTPPGLPEGSRVQRVEASHADAETAYACVFGPRGDLSPYAFRTRDGGRTWQKIVTGLPARGFVHVVREDTSRKGLLYAGTDKGVFVSFDGGDSWQPLQLNLPTSPVRDLYVHAGDLIAATYGRGLWILDDLSPLRQSDANATGRARLFKPSAAVRVRWDNWQETPLEKETPAGENPPDGAVIDYYLKSPARELTLEIRDSRGRVLRRFTSAPRASANLPANVPEYWFAPPEALTAKPGLNRFVWNLRLADPPALPFGFRGGRLDYVEFTLPDHAVPGETPRSQPPGPLVVPGEYEVVLTVDGETFRQSLAVNLDPRVRVASADLSAQLELAEEISAMMRASYDSYDAVTALRAGLAERMNKLSADTRAKDAADAAAALDKELEAIADGATEPQGLGFINRDLSRYMTMVESADARPADSARARVGESCDALRASLARLRGAEATSLPALNALLNKYGLAPLAAPTATAEPKCVK
ncbi:MAG TPA: hypothetical protein VJ866_07805 [Pyrinomonadaceae bacterium]|nr:hypothetical protein [Pyrinomonadaceae bacterium]